MTEQTLLKRFARNRMAVAGAVFLFFIVALSILAPLIFRAGPFALVGAPFQPVFGQWLLGADSLGRDVAAGLAYGGLTSMTIGFVATLVAVVIGVAVGAMSGYYGGPSMQALCG